MPMDQATQSDRDREVEGSLQQRVTQDDDNWPDDGSDLTWAPCRSNGPQSQLPTRGSFYRALLQPRMQPPLSTAKRLQIL